MSSWDAVAVIMMQDTRLIHMGMHRIQYSAAGACMLAGNPSSSSGNLPTLAGLMQVEDKTPFARWYAPGTTPLPSDEASADMYRTASAMLRAAGYEHYEISSYAKPGHRYKVWPVWAG